MAKKKEETTEAQVEVAENKAKTYIYVGPIIKNGLYPTGKLVTEHFKEELKEELEKVPTLNKLFIPIEEYSKLHSELDNPNSIYQKFIKDVVIANV